MIKDDSSVIVRDSSLIVSRWRSEASKENGKRIEYKVEKWTAMIIAHYK